MSLSGPLRDEFFRYRKRKQISLDGSVGGLEHHRLRGEYAAADIGPWGLPPQAYEPHPGLAQFPESEYEAYQGEMVAPLPTPPIRLNAPSPANVEPSPDYDACLMTDELYLQAMREVNGQPAPQEPVPFDHDVRAHGIMHSPDSLEAILDVDTQSDPVRDMVAALDEQIQMMSPQPAMPELEPPEQGPCEMQQQMYEQQLQMMDQFMMGPPPMM